MKTVFLKLSFLCLLPLFLNACEDKPIVRSEYKNSEKFEALLDKYEDEMENYSLTKRTEIKIKNLEDKCSKDDLEACWTLMLFYETNMNHIGDPQKATDLLHKLCLSGNPHSCRFISEYYTEGVRFEKNPDKAKEYKELTKINYEKKCKEGNFDNCMFYLQDIEPEEYKNKLIGLCEKNSINACYLLSKGKKGKFQPSKEEAQYYGEKRDSLIKEQCYFSSEKYDECRDFGVYHYFREFNKNTQKEIIEFSKSKCEEKDSDKCYNLSLIYSLPEYENMDKRIEALSKGCDLKNDSACYELASFFEKKDKIDKEQLKHLYEMACELDNYDACVNLAKILATDENNLDKAYELICYVSENDIYERNLYLNNSLLNERVLKRLCFWNKNPKSCEELVEVYSNKHDYNKANPLLTYFCDIEGNASFCQTLSEHYDMGLGFEKDSNKAYDYANRVCEIGSYLCKSIARDYEEGNKHEKNLRLSHELYEKSCSNGVNSSCIKVANNYVLGLGVDKDPYKALNLLVDKCKLDDQETFEVCLEYANILEREPFENYKDASLMFKGICEKDTSLNMKEKRDEACINYAHNLKYGFGLEKSEKNANELYKKICEETYSNCSSISYNLSKKDELTPNLYTKQLEINKELCSLGNGYYCGIVGELFEFGDKIPRDLQQAAFYYKKGCNFKESSALSCYRYAYLVSNNSVKVSNQIDETFKYNQKACSLNPKYCNNLGALYFNVKKDYVKANIYYRKACDAENWFACKNLGVNLIEGKGASQDIKQGFSLVEKACNNKDSYSCYVLGGLYQEGKGIRKDLIKAKEYFGFACDLGSQDGCREFARLP